MHKTMKTKPTIYKTKLWKLLEKQYKSLPKFNIRPLDENNKEDKKKAKMMDEILNYQFKKNINGFQTKYFELQKKLAKMYADEMLYGITVRWEDMEKTIKNLAGTNYENKTK